jgi:Domain of unknown function (DUF4252)
MRHPKFEIVFLIVSLLCLSTGAMAGDLTGQPGYVDLEFIDIPDSAEEIQDIDLGIVLKDVVREAKANDDLEIAELLAMVHSLRLRAYSIDEDSLEMTKDAIAKVSAIMKKDDWDTLMKFKDGSELTTINIKYHNDNMVGLMVVVFDPDEEVLFVNVVGDLDLGKLMKLAGEFDADELEMYLEKVEDIKDERSY